jgi:hypothetical protein
MRQVDSRRLFIAGRAAAEIAAQALNCCQSCTLASTALRQQTGTVSTGKVADGQTAYTATTVCAAFLPGRAGLHHTA